MSLKVVIVAAARLEIAEAVKYYEEERPSAGVNFWIEFKLLAKRLKIYPELYPKFGKRGIAKRGCAFIHTRFIIGSQKMNCACSASCMAR